MWALVLHGGAKEIEHDEAEAHRKGCLDAIAAGQIVLARGGAAIDAVEASIRVLESDPTFNAGYGSALNADGEVEMCSAMMEGAEFNVGAVTVIKGVWHPISVARAMLYQEPILLAAEGARHFAELHGIDLCDSAQLVLPKQLDTRRSGAHDTVGCIALDEQGNIAVGTSTGGLEGSPAGRVGDSPMPGCGFYADNAIGAAAFSGDGEHIARKMLAARVMHALDAASPDHGLETAIEHVAEIGGEAGGIALNADGRFSWAHNSREFAVAISSSELVEPRCFLRRQEAIS
jgi:beta-aspartyl-peptidase (threonine type)